MSCGDAWLGTVFGANTGAPMRTPTDLGFRVFPGPVHDRTAADWVRSADTGEASTGHGCRVRAAVVVDLVALLLSLLALLLATRGMLAWTAVDTSGHSNLAQSHFCLVSRRLTRERPLVQVQHGPPGQRPADSVSMASNWALGAILTVS